MIACIVDVILTLGRMVPKPFDPMTRTCIVHPCIPYRSLRHSTRIDTSLAVEIAFRWDVARRQERDGWKVDELNFNPSDLLPLLFTSLSPLQLQLYLIVIPTGLWRTPSVGQRQRGML